MLKIAKRRVIADPPGSVALDPRFVMHYGDRLRGSEMRGLGAHIASSGGQGKWLMSLWVCLDSLFHARDFLSQKKIPKSKVGGNKALYSSDGGGLFIRQSTTHRLS